MTKFPDKNKSPRVPSLHWNRQDLFLIAFFILLSIFLLFWLFLSHPSSGDLVKITKGDTVLEYPLNKDQTIEIKGDGYYNKIVIKDSTVSILESDCKDQICTRHAPIKKPGEMIVCLPHELVVTICAGDPDSSGKDSDSFGKDSDSSGMDSDKDSIDGISK